MLKTYEITNAGIKCLFCEKTSTNKHDIDERYCGFCKKFHPPLPYLPLEMSFRPTMYDRVFDTSPNTGSPECKCSHCAQVISEGIAIRFFREDNKEYRYHPKCLGIKESDEYDDDFSDY